MTKDIFAEKRADFDRRKRRQSVKTQEEARRDRIEITAAVLVQSLGQSEAAGFLSKLEGLRPGEARFRGTKGIDAVRHPVATGLEIGYALTPDEGAAVALKATCGNETMVITLEPAAMAALAGELVHQLATTWNRRHLHMDSDAAHAYEDFLASVADDVMDVSGERQRIYQEARSVAAAEKEAAIRAQSAVAEEKALRKAETIVRKLSMAAAMPAGTERSLILEEVQPAIRKAFGDD